MLLHISPKEDDLAETVCSLNFGTRTRGIQLGREMSAVCLPISSFRLNNYVSSMYSEDR